MAAATTLTNASSFTYKELVLHVQAIQYQMIEGMKHLDDRWTNDKETRGQLRSHRLTIIDPYGNLITQRYMNQEIVRAILKKFKENYVPKCLHSWIQFGQLIENEIKPLKESQLNSSVGTFEREHPIVTYGVITIWMETSEPDVFQKNVLKVRLNDNIEKIQLQLKRLTDFTTIKLKACTIDQHTKPNKKDWHEGTTLKPEDTIISKNLYENHCFIMGKITEMVTDPLVLSRSLQFFSFYRMMRQIRRQTFKSLSNFLLETHQLQSRFILLRRSRKSKQCLKKKKAFLLINNVLYLLVDS